VRYCRLCLQLLSLKSEALKDNQCELLEYSDTFLSSGAREFRRVMHLFGASAFRAQEMLSWRGMFAEISALLILQR
jgi:hypothetical protein